MESAHVLMGKKPGITVGNGLWIMKARGSKSIGAMIGWMLCLGLAAQALAQEGDREAVSQAKLLSRAFRGAAKRVSPAVVTVVTQVDEYRRVQDGDGVREKLIAVDESVGSGVIIHHTGVVLTNSHVLESGDRVVVRIAGGREYAAYDIRRDPWSDVAILRMKNPPSIRPVTPSPEQRDADFPASAAKLGNSDELEIGDWVIAVGSPFELEATVSAGIISGKNRGLEKIRRGKLLQTDAAINPGNSGGPLVNLAGEVVGINTAIASSSGGYQGVSFVIPINHARWVVNELATHGKVRRGYLGVSIDPLLPRDAASRGLPTMGGVIVTQVRPNSAAASAGLKADDVIIEFAGMPVRDVRDLQGLVEQKQAGSEHPLTIYRDGQTARLRITVQKLVANEREK